MSMTRYILPTCKARTQFCHLARFQCISNITMQSCQYKKQNHHHSKLNMLATMSMARNNLPTRKGRTPNFAT